jgi:threonine dehydrogenase-like Zn-dependent dehydrogenase
MRSVAADFQSRRLLERNISEPPPPAAGEVLLRIAAVGVCGTDRDIGTFTAGEPPAGDPYLVIGHEALAEVVECGPRVEGVAAGDWVVPMVRRPCAVMCNQCASGRRDLCTTLQFSERGIWRAHGYFTDYAVDNALDLVRVDPALAEEAVLIEPLSVVEKAVERALQVVQGSGRRALVLGLGPIGILAASALRLRGFEVTVFSAEPPDHPRVKLLDLQDIRYTTALDTAPADVIIEAAGSGELSFAAMQSLAPCGAMIIIGARNTPGVFPFLDLLIRNQTVAGIVNAAPSHFEAAGSDLMRIPAPVRSGMIERFAFSDFGVTLSRPLGAAPKAVHILWE